MKLFLIGFATGGVTVHVLWYLYAAKVKAALAKAEATAQGFAAQAKKVI